MMNTQNQNPKNTEDPPVLLDATQMERLYGMAESLSVREPDVAEQLLNELNRAAVVAPGDLPHGVVTIGSSVTYFDETSQSEKTVTVVLPTDANIASQRISVLTPIGAALIGLAEGSAINWQTRNGEVRKLTITRVSPPGSDQV
ncbi:nucleoside diphosphate kinase regulator [Fodinicurvata fenggangensis]|uniref:nucleoside diphosphate kinase regulator n=1 Tax=Fodinicurvata fenggangensis TaxID=1121830 RepID=UPI0012DF7E66|nr:nucleoside diphosphate kinase regulator [Fodinicurvata fenggangensis]